MAELTMLRAIWHHTRARIKAMHEDESGVTSWETVLMYVLVGIAVFAVGAIITAKLMERANAIPTQ